MVVLENYFTHHRFRNNASDIFRGGPGDWQWRMYASRTPACVRVCSIACVCACADVLRRMFCCVAACDFPCKTCVAVYSRIETCVAV